MAQILGPENGHVFETEGFEKCAQGLPVRYHLVLCLWEGGTSPSALSTGPALHGRKRFPFPPNDLGPNASLTCNLPDTTRNTR